MYKLASGSPTINVLGYTNALVSQYLWNIFYNISLKLFYDSKDSCLKMFVCKKLPVCKNIFLALL